MATLVQEKWSKKVEKYDTTPKYAREDMRISGNAYRLWVTLFTGDIDWKPDEARLATQFGVTEKTIYRWIKELRYYGYMKIIGSQERGYTWIINKYSHGIFNTVADKFVTYKNREKQTNKSATKVTKMSANYNNNGCPPTGGEAAIDNKEVENNKKETNSNLQDLEEDFNKFFDND